MEDNEKQTRPKKNIQSKVLKGIDNVSDSIAEHKFQILSISIPIFLIWYTINKITNTMPMP